MQMIIRKTFIALVALAGTAGASGAEHQDQLLQTREAVWRAWFANDKQVLEKLVPDGTIVISAGEGKWKNRAEVIQSAAEFQAEGGKLVRLEFPRTEIQHFGNVAIVYSQFQLETEAGGKRKISSGRVTEVFVRRRGQWVNPGWHTDSEPQ